MHVLETGKNFHFKKKNNSDGSNNKFALPKFIHLALAAVLASICVFKYEQSCVFLSVKNLTNTAEIFTPINLIYN